MELQGPGIGGVAGTRHLVELQGPGIWWSCRDQAFGGVAGTRHLVELQGPGISLSVGSCLRDQALA